MDEFIYGISDIHQALSYSKPDWAIGQKGRMRHLVQWEDAQSFGKIQMTGSEAWLDRQSSVVKGLYIWVATGNTGDSW